MENNEQLGMVKPELLLKGLNAALRELHGAVKSLEDTDLCAQMLPVMRRLLLAEVLGKESVIAIGGSQGAGKTTLLNALYALNGEDAEWLQPNEGQGECMPVLVVEEHGRTQAQGAVRRLAGERHASFGVKEVYLEKEAFQKVVRNPEPSDLLPMLLVPRRYFHRQDQAWLLLPGYESETRQNKEWQRLMRQALVGAAGCIIVTDETRMANQEQVDIVKDMMNKELRGAQALVAISKTEGARGQSDRLQALRTRAQQIFFEKEPEADRRVICTGVDDEDYVAEWLPDLSTRLEDLAIAGGGGRHAQLRQLESVLDQDLAALMTRIRTKVDLWLGQQEYGESGEVVKACLEVFDEAQGELRADYQSAMGRMLDKQYDKARKPLRIRLEKDHEGWINHLKDFFRKASKSQRLVEQAVTDAWKEPGSVLDGYAEAVLELTSKKLEAREVPEIPAAAQSQDSSKDSLQQRLGYTNGQKLLQWGRPDDDDQHNLRVLFGKKPSSVDGKEDERVRVRFEHSVKLLPALGLEFARMASVMPEMVGVRSETLAPADMLQRPDLIGGAMQNLDDGVNMGRTVLRSIAAVLAFDVVADGDLDVPGVLSSALGGGAAKAATGGATAGAVTGIGAAVVGLVAVGYLAHSAMKEVRQHDEKAIVMFQLLLRSIRDQHLEHFMRHFDDLMSKLRARLKQALQERYHMSEVLMEKDRLAKALADVRALRRDLLDELGRSGATSPIFQATSGT